MKTEQSAPYEQQGGFIVGTLLVLLLIISVMLVTITSAALGNYQSASKENARVNAQFVADAGLDIGIHELNLDENWAGTGSPVEHFNDGTVRTTYEVTVSPGSNEDRKNIRSVGKAYRPVSSSTAMSTKIFELEVEAVTTGYGPGSVVSGVGGLVLNNNAKITGGDVIVNGTVTISNGAQIGLSTNPINLRVAHQSCPIPVNATYPQPCTSGQPISNDGLIYGEVYAQNQVNTNGMFSPGLVSSTFAPVAVPGYDRAAHRAGVTDTYNATDSAIACGNNQSKTWNLSTNDSVKIVGNVALGNGCTVTINGNVWITGNLTFGNSSRIIVANTLGLTRPVVMIDGSSGFVTGNNSIIIPNSSGTGAEVVTTWWNTNTATNGNFNCGGIVELLDCSNVTGLALSTSQTTTTINLSNNTIATNTVFRSLWTRAVIANNGALGAVSGQTVQMDSNAIINFTASVPGSDNLRKTWVKKGYLRVYQ